jgi:transketolase
MNRPLKELRQQFADTMLSVGQEDPNLVVLIGDISHFILQPFAQACPGRFYNVGICEPTIVSMGAGLAKVGLYPVMHTIAPFLIERSFEQIKLDFCYQRLGGSLVTVGSAFDYANVGCTHHCYDDWALIKSLPGTQIVYSASPVEFDALFRQTYRNGAVTLFRLAGYQHGYDFAEAELQFGKGIKVTEGRNLTIIATGPHLRDTLGAKDELMGIGWEPEIIYVHTIRPLDTDLIRASVRKTRRVLVLEEHVRNGGLGDDVLKAVYDIGDVQFSWIGIPDSFIHEYRPYQQHCDALGLSQDGIIKSCVETLRA